MFVLHSWEPALLIGQLYIVSVVAKTERDFWSEISNFLQTLLQLYLLRWQVSF